MAELLLPVVAIDGPSGAGKSTVAKAVAYQLGWRHLDTGSMYRAVTLRLLDLGVALADLDGVTAALDDLQLQLGESGRIWFGEVEVTERLRQREVEQLVSAVSALRIVRQRMKGLQRAQAELGPLVAEGRDMTSVVFPDARFKFYVDADARERARRRLEDFRRRGRELDLDKVYGEIVERDRLDSSREDAPLIRVPDAVYLDTTGRSISDVVRDIVRRVETETASSDS